MPLNLNDEIIEDLTSESFLEPVGNRGVITFLGSTQNGYRSSPNDEVCERTPLLKKVENEAEIELPTPNFQFGILTGNIGLWHRDVSGKNLIRFVVLLLFLVFSSFVVSII